MRKFFLLAGLALALPLAAQQNVAYLDGDSNASTGSGNAFPFGSAGIRYQAIVPASLFGTSPVLLNDLLVAGDTSTSRPSPSHLDYTDIEFRFGYTTLTDPTTDWNTNNPSPFASWRGPLSVELESNQWRALGLPISVPVNPASGNLCIEVIVWGTVAFNGVDRSPPSNFYFPRASSTLRRAFLYNWVNNQANSPSTGTSGCRFGFVLDSGAIGIGGNACKSSNSTVLQMAAAAGTYPQIGKTFVVELAGGLPSSPAFLVLGTSVVRFDLGSFGMTDCFLRNDILLTLGAAVPPTGNAALKLPIPADKSLLGAFLAGQWANLDKAANAFGLTTSSQGRLTVGI